jgi:hypothetical protein
MNMEERRVREDSDELLDAVDELKRLERSKRSRNISTPRFHDVADRVEDQARQVFHIAARETIDGDKAGTSDSSIDEIPPPDGRN